MKLANGSYTAVTVLFFAEQGDTEGERLSYWTVEDKENLTTASLSCVYRFSKWSIMSYAAKRFDVEEGRTTSISIAPAAVGALCYGYFQNFQYESEADYPNVGDNGIRSLTIFAQSVAQGYRLDPDATEKFIYRDELETGTWYWLSDQMVPEDFDGDWTHFESNLYDYFYVLQPNVHLVFGYIPEGEDSFYSYGERSYTLTSGQTYLAYWDYFQIGNPYFGVADNNHWNSYESETKKRESIETASMQPACAKKRTK